MKRLTDTIFVAGQIKADDFAAIAAAGIKTIINNRPDDEVMFQPKASELEALAKEHDINFHNIQFSQSLDPAQVQEFAELLETASGPILAFCRTGTRSTTIWALSQVGRLSAQSILEAAGNAGYDLRHLLPMLDKT